MGLNVGVRIKQQPEEIYQFGSNPKGTPDDIALALYRHLEKQFDCGEGFTITVELRDGWWKFDCRIHGYGRYLAEDVTSNDLLREIIIWAWPQFDDQHGTEMRTYYAP